MCLCSYSTSNTPALVQMLVMETTEQSSEGNVCIFLTDARRGAASRSRSGSFSLLVSGRFGRESCFEHQITGSMSRSRCLAFSSSCSPLFLPPFSASVIYSPDLICRSMGGMKENLPLVIHFFITPPPSLLIPDDPNNLSGVIRHDLHQDIVPCHLLLLITRTTSGIGLETGTRMRCSIHAIAGCVCLSCCTSFTVLPWCNRICQISVWRKIAFNCQLIHHTAGRSGG